MKYESGNYFSLPNEIFLLGLNAGELAVYSYLKRCENRKTHQCWPSIRTIGEAVGMSGNTVRSTSASWRNGHSSSQSKQRLRPGTARGATGNLLYTLRPIPGNRQRIL